MRSTSRRIDLLTIPRRLDPASKTPAAEGAYSATEALTRLTASSYADAAAMIKELDRLVASGFGEGVGKPKEEQDA